MAMPTNCSLVNVIHVPCSACIHVVSTIRNKPWLLSHVILNIMDNLVQPKWLYCIIKVHILFYKRKLLEIFRSHLCTIWAEVKRWWSFLQSKIVWDISDASQQHLSRSWDMMAVSTIENCLRYFGRISAASEQKLRDDGRCRIECPRNGTLAHKSGCPQIL